MEIRYSLHLPRDGVTVPLVRTICRDAMHRLGVTPDCQGDVALALTEACANVIRHAEGASEYEVAIEFCGALCHIRVVDKEGLTVLRLEGYRTVTFPAPVAAERLEPLRRAVGS